MSDQPVNGEHVSADEHEHPRLAFYQTLMQVPPAPTTARGIHHTALISSDVERTVAFYQGLLGFPLTSVLGNRDYPGSTHFFFDVGNGNTIAFFDFPGLDLGRYAEVVGGLHHVALSVERSTWEQLRQRLVDIGVPIHETSGSSVYFTGPDGERLELISDPLGEMYGEDVLHPGP